MYKYSYFDLNYSIFLTNNNWLKKNKHLIIGNAYELGCGLQPLRKFILETADKYVPVDWEESVHDVKPDIYADLNKPIDKIADNVADSIISISVMEHLYNPANLVNESYRILKPGASMLLQIPFQWLVHDAPYDYCRFTRYGLQKLFNNAGFVDVQIQEQILFWTTWTLKFNYHLDSHIVSHIRPFKLQRLARFLIKPIYFLNQAMALCLDKINKNPEEAGCYFVVAKK